MRLIYATDFHGNRNAIEQVFMAARNENADAILLGGDITPKTIAIKLAAQNDPFSDNGSDFSGSQKSEYRGGEILPVDMLKQDKTTKTYLASLQMLKNLNREFGPGAMAEFYRKQGCIIHEIHSAFYELESMIMEQELFEKLFKFFRLNGDCRLELTDEELDIIRDSFVDWVRKYESGLSETQKASFSQRCASTFGSKKREFSFWAPSKHFEECLLGAVCGNELRHLMDRIMLEAQKDDNRAARHLDMIFHEMREKLMRSFAYKMLIEEDVISSLVEYSTIAQVIKDAEKLENITDGQAGFLKNYLFPLIREWKSANKEKPVYLMFSNDDIYDNVRLLQEAEREGIIVNLTNDIKRLSDDVFLAGYGFVDSLPPGLTYARWLKDDEEIKADLRSLSKQAESGQLIWMIHQPPLGYLDMSEEGHIGSKAILEFISESEPKLALFGHVHEAPRLIGSISTMLGATKCVNPGGEHRNSAKMALITLENLEVTGG